MVAKNCVCCGRLGGGAVRPEFANAQYGGWCGSSPWYTGYSSEYVPYYAMHPPVYYSYPVPRPYGYSPFAYPPGVYDS